MRVLDSRRLTGPSLLLNRPGAILDIALNDMDADGAAVAWRKAAVRLLGAAGWTGQELACRHFRGGISLALSAPVDCLYAATDLNEAAWAIAARELNGEPPLDVEDQAAGLRESIAKERNPALQALRDQALARRLTFLIGEDQVSAGSGAAAAIWDEKSLPRPETVDWSEIHDIPLALVTGSNGKTTVVRLLSAMARAGDRTAGTTSTDGVTVGSRCLVEGDFSGPSGARAVLRDREVEIAILEIARGGILRRGLAVNRADVAVVTNIAADHLGEFGIETLDDLAETKLVVAKALEPSGTLVLNADDPLLARRSDRMPSRVTWFSLDPGSPVVERHVRAGGTAVVTEQGRIVLTQGDHRAVVVSLEKMPIAFGGAARHNVANALAAVAGAAALGLGLEAIARTLSGFGREVGDNPGRTNLLELGGVRLMLDFAHNPHGMAALVGVAQAVPARRRLIMVGQAGDRDDEAIRDLARAAWTLQPDHVVVKEMDQYRRGRAPGEVPALLADEFSRLGAPDAAITLVGQEVDGLREALSWARPGDLLVLAVHQDRRSVLRLLGQLRAADWHPGEPLPESAAEKR
jgi:UDP-N-acetylmuramyl tripeptide synthase